MHYLALFFSGAFLSNAAPHTAAGLQGQPFPSPFAKPAGVGDSSPLVNVLWGFLNLLAGLVLLAHNPVEVGLNLEFAALAGGVLVMGLQLSVHFGKVQAAKTRK